MSRNRAATPTQETAQEKLWREFGEANREERIQAFAGEHRAKDIAWWKSLDKVSTNYPKPCPKCGSWVRTPKLEKVRGGDLCVGITRECGKPCLYAFHAPHSSYYGESRFAGVSEPLEVIKVTCICGHVMGPYRPNDAGA